MTTSYGLGLSRPIEAMLYKTTMCGFQRPFSGRRIITSRWGGVGGWVLGNVTKRDRVGRWVKNGHFWRDVIMQWPLTCITCIRVADATLLVPPPMSIWQCSVAYNNGRNYIGLQTSAVRRLAAGIEILIWHWGEGWDAIWFPIFVSQTFGGGGRRSHTFAPGHKLLGG